MKLSLLSAACADAAISMGDLVGERWAWRLVGFAIGFGIVAWRAA